MSTDLDVISEEVRSWLAENLERKSDENAVVSSDHEERALQARLAGGGFGGLMVHVEYGAAV